MELNDEHSTRPPGTYVPRPVRRRGSTWADHAIRACKPWFPLASAVTPAAPVQPVTATPATPVPADEPEESGQGVPPKVKVAALAAGAAAFANKVRKEAPKKIQEAREKSVAGRYVVLTEVDGRPVAIGPYRKEQAATQDATRVTGAQQVVELRSRAAHFRRSDGDSTTPL